MDGLDDFMLFNACEDAREEAEREGTTEHPYCKQFWDSDNDSEPKSDDSCDTDFCNSSYDN